MTWLRPALAMLIALSGSTAYAGPPVPRKYQAGFYLEGCKDFVAGRSNFLSGRCVGPSKFLMNWARTINRFVRQRQSTTLNWCASLLLTLKVYPNDGGRVSGFWLMKRWQKLGRAKIEISHKNCSCTPSRNGTLLNLSCRSEPKMKTPCPFSRPLLDLRHRSESLRSKKG